MRWTDLARAFPAILILTAGTALAEKPLSANDWVTGKGERPPTVSGWRPGDPVPRDAQKRRSGPVPRPATDLATSGAPGQVGVKRLGGGNADAVGTLSARLAGLPVDLWAGSTTDVAIRQIHDARARLPAMRVLLRNILMAQLTPPANTGATPEGAFLDARADRLTNNGTVQDARALLRAAGSGDRDRFHRLFNIALLQGQDEGVCTTMTRAPALAPDLASRVYCLAQQGDWMAAALVMQGGRDMGVIDPATVALLVRYLDDGYADMTEQLPWPKPLTPLGFRLFEGIGQPILTTELPLPFAVADLGENGGWKARLDAAERLARAGAMRPGDLAAIYDEQRPAASGGVWERVAAYQRLDAALANGDDAARDAALPAAMAAFGPENLVPMLAPMVAGRIPQTVPAGDAGLAALRLRLLAGLPVTPGPDTLPADAWLARFAVDPATAGAPTDDPQGIAAMLADAVNATPVATATPDPMAAPAGDKATLMLAAITDVDAGLEGDFARAARGLATLVSLGQARPARQAAVELMILPRISTPR
ncbi:MAG: hypothetical protein DI498_02605 [Paracoccus denitrificans]|nr:MAG: hypothetical protein DI498_02605 [Paracoccus denitrificans]PZO86030.1 MAG: hypothetical protein DI633_02605 [Paracoccus denitrificans]